MSGVLEIIGLAFAAPPIIERTIRYGRRLYRNVHAMHYPECVFGDLSRFQNKDGLLFTACMMARQIANDTSVNDQVREQISNDFQAIQEKINEANRIVDKMEKAGKLERLWVANKTKRSLEECTQNLENTLKDFMFLVDLVGNSHKFPAAEWLSSEAFQPTAGAERIIIADGVEIIQGHLAEKRVRTDPKVGTFARERRYYIANDQSDIENRIKKLAGALSQAQPSDGILNIVGYRHDAHSKSFELIFDISERYKFKGTLRTLMQESGPASLNERISLCTQLADAVFHVHKLGLVHKNINTGNIIVMTDKQQSPYRPGPGHFKIFLTNWHLVRKQGTATLLLGNTHGFERLYQHPTRQSLQAELPYSIGHDIYSLGVCMLELLLWKPFIIFDPRQKLGLSSEFLLQAASANVPPDQYSLPSYSSFPTPASSISSLAQKQPTFASSSSSASQEQSTSSVTISQKQLSSPPEPPAPPASSIPTWPTVPLESVRSIEPRQFQTILLRLAQKRLPMAAGDRLTGLVMNCLNVLETGFGDIPMVQPDSVETGLNYMAAVKDVLEQIRI